MMWQDLDAEFEKWRAADMTLPFWWRDDDAVTVTPQLDALAALSQDVDVPVHVAVVPAGVQADLAGYVDAAPHLIPIVHGYAHENHAQVGKKCEYPESRAIADVERDLRAGFGRLHGLFGSRLRRMFVPPWNRFAHTFMPALQSLGYTGFSTFTPRQNKWVARGVEQINTHVDPIDWHGARSLADPALVLDHTVRSLRDRRLGHTDNEEPFGFLTHHLVHDDAIWTFSQEFLHRFASGPTRIWTADELEKG